MKMPSHDRPHLVDGDPVSRTQEGLLYVSKHITVAFVDFKSDALYISFNEIGIEPQGNDFWGKSFFVKEKMSAIGIVSTKPNWYPPKDMKKAITIIRSFIAQRSFKSVVTYGCSQGGYGALKYGRALKAHAAIAFSPQYSIDPAVMGYFDQRFTEYFKPRLGGGLKIQSVDLCDRNYIIFDHHNDYDNRNAAMIATVGPVTLINTAFTGHGPISLLADGRIGKAFLDEISLKNGRINILRTLLRGARHKSHIYFRERARWLIDHKRSPQLIAHAMDKALPLMPQKVGWKVDFLYLQAQVRNPDIVRAQINALLPELDFRDAIHRGWGKAVARFLDEIGDHEKARTLLDVIAKKQPPLLRIKAKVREGLNKARSVFTKKDLSNRSK